MSLWSYILANRETIALRTSQIIYFLTVGLWGVASALLVVLLYTRDGSMISPARFGAFLVGHDDLRGAAPVVGRILDLEAEPAELCVERPSGCAVLERCPVAGGA